MKKIEIELSLYGTKGSQPLFKFHGITEEYDVTLTLEEARTLYDQLQRTLRSFYRIQGQDWTGIG